MTRYGLGDEQDRAALILHMVRSLSGRLALKLLATPSHADEAISFALARLFLEQNGLLALAKDLARLTADGIDIVGLRTVCAPPKGQTWRSLKSLENELGTILEKDQAYTLLTPLVGIYELRLGDAHLPSSTLDDAFNMIGIDRSAHAVATADPGKVGGG